MLLRLLLIAFALILSACAETRDVDVSSQPGYRGLAGAKYTVVGTVTAYGIRKHSKAAIEYFTVIPPPGIEGSEVGVRLPVPIVSTLTVLSIHETNRLFDPSISFGIQLTGVAMAANLPTRIDLMRGNQGADKLSLNPAIFQRN